MIKEKIMNSFDYVADLSLAEKLIFLRMIIRLIGKDGRIDADERLFMKELAEQYHIPKEYGAQINKKSTEDELIAEAQSLLDRKKSIYLIKELLMIANVDNDLDDTEIDFVIKVSKALNIEDQKVSDLNQLVLDQISLQEKLIKVLELNKA